MPFGIRSEEEPCMGRYFPQCSRAPYSRINALSGTEATFFDYRETAPALATKTMFADGKVDFRSHQSAGVPGTVRGMALAHKRYGSKPWKELVAPAAKLAEGRGAVWVERINLWAGIGGSGLVMLLGLALLWGSLAPARPF